MVYPDYLHITTVMLSLKTLEASNLFLRLGNQIEPPSRWRRFFFNLYGLLTERSNGMPCDFAHLLLLIAGDTVVLLGCLLIEVGPCPA
jgi:hypothetical protein